MSGLSFLSSFRHGHGDPVFVDVGTGWTKVIWRGEVVFAEPSWVVVDGSGQNLVALGQSATNLSGKLSPELHLSPVMVRGQLSDNNLFTLFARGLQQRLTQSRIDQAVGLRVVYSISSASSEFNQKIFKQAWLQAGWRVQASVLKSTALHAALPRPFLCVVDHGAAVTEVAIFSHGKPILAQTLFLGGQQSTQAILDQTRSDSGVILSWAGAEQVKQKIGRVSIKDEVADSSSKISVRAGQNASHTHQTLVLHSDQFLTTLNQLADELCQQLDLIFSQLSREVTAELSQHGIILAGGGAKLRGLAGRIAANLGLPVSLATSPELSVVKGLVATGGR